MGKAKDVGSQIDKVIDQVEDKVEQVVEEVKGEWTQEVVPFHVKYKKEIRLAAIGLGIILLGGLVLRGGTRK